MNQPESLKSNESLSSESEQQAPLEGSLTKQAATELYNSRQRMLDLLKSFISLKLYHQIAEKLEQEKNIWAKLLHWEDTKQDILSHYTFVLNPNYFEQRFFG